MKVKSISDLAFKVLDKLTQDEDELWVAHIIFDGQADHTGNIQRIMKKDCGLSYDAVQKVLKALVEKGIIRRVRVGLYAPNLNMVLSLMLHKLLEEKK